MRLSCDSLSFSLSLPLSLSTSRSLSLPPSLPPSLSLRSDKESNHHSVAAAVYISSLPVHSHRRHFLCQVHLHVAPAANPQLLHPSLSGPGELVLYTCLILPGPGGLVLCTCLILPGLLNFIFIKIFIEIILQTHLNSRNSLKI